MFKVAEKEEKEKIIENTRRCGELETLSLEIPQTPCLNLCHNELVIGDSSSVKSRRSQYSSSNSFSNGFCLSAEGSPFSSPFEETKYQPPTTHFLNRQWLDSKSPEYRYWKNFNTEKLVGDSLCGDLSGVHIRDEERGDDQTRRFGVDSNGLWPRFTDGSSGVNGKIRCYDDKYNPCDGLNPNGLRPSVYDPCYADTFVQNNGDRGVTDRLAFSESMHPDLALLMNNSFDGPSLLNERTFVKRKHRVPTSFASLKNLGDIEAFSCEDSLIIQGKGLKYVSGVLDPSTGQKKNFPGMTSMCNPQEESSKLHNLISNAVSKAGQRLTSYKNAQFLPAQPSMTKVQGSVYFMAKHQNGCRLLQRIIEEGSLSNMVTIYNEIIDYVVELMVDPFGNYLVQKLLDACSQEQKMQILLMVTKEPGWLVKVSLNTYGTRVVQKLIKTIRTREQISLVKSALQPGFLDLVKDLNGNHVIQRCLQFLSMEDNKFIFDAATKLCVNLATHRHGCCVLQRCIAHSTSHQRDKLITEISRNALVLAQDPFGNYVIQYVIELKIPGTSANLLSQFKGNYVHLSMQKFSSHVVERCLTHIEESRAQIIHELLLVPHFEDLLQDPFANYVIQSALSVTKGYLHGSRWLKQSDLAMLRSSPYCRRIFSLVKK